MSADRAIGMTVHEVSTSNIVTHGGEVALVRCTCGFEARVSGFDRAVLARDMIEKHLAVVRESITSRRQCTNCKQSFPVSEMEAGYGTGWVCDMCLVECRRIEEARVHGNNVVVAEPSFLPGLEVRIGADGFWLCGEIGKVGEPGRRQAMKNVPISSDTHIIIDVFRQLHAQLWPEGSSVARRFKLIEVT